MTREHAPPADPSRREFLKLAGAAAAGVGLDAALPAAPASAVETTEALAEEHAGDPGLLIDLTKCVGCGSCVTACKLDNGLEWRKDQPATGPDAALASSNWTAVRTARADSGEAEPPRYVKGQCMHCLEPACVSACFVKALKKSPAGPVVYDGDMCVGCRYCLVACPFSVPTFEWDETFGRIQKCDLCAERTSRGLPTACAGACPSGAITFGRRGELLKEAWRRIDAEPRYVKRVYGEKEAGGTSVMYVSDVPFEALGFREGLPTEPLPLYTWQITRLIPPVAAGLGTLLVTLYLRRRRFLLEKGEEDES